MTRMPQRQTVKAHAAGQDRFGHFDLALPPVNGLCIRPLNDAQVVMAERPCG